MDRMIRESECRLRTGLARSTRWAMERRGLFPRRRRLARNAVGWLESELLEWMKSRETATENPLLREHVNVWPNHAGAARQPAADAHETAPRDARNGTSRRRNPRAYRSPK